jgi:hypothetical protein
MLNANTGRGCTPGMRDARVVIVAEGRRPAVGSGRPTLLAPRSSDAEDFFA